tara:strand:- start:5224 stop:5457 length:234 start_codon:yes stop_codon:yes gene_type:complete
MPQIGWFEILLIVVLSILIIGPKDFPIVLNKIGNWIGGLKRYFSEIQNSMSDIEDTFDENISLDENKLKNKKEKKDE